MPRHPKHRLDEELSTIDEKLNERERLLRNGLLRQAGAARQHPLDFFNFTARHELTRQRLTALPFQRVFFKFTFDHACCAVWMPPGYSKTACMTTFSLFTMGVDPTSRGAVIGAVVEVAKRPMSAMKEVIENIDAHYPEIRIVFPNLRRSQQYDAAWGNSKFTIERPPGIKEPTAAAYGLDSPSVIGTRLKWVSGDDILTLDNTHSVELREYTKTWFQQVIVRRLDVPDPTLLITEEGRCVITNTPYDPDDLLHELRKPKSQDGKGWPTLMMDAYGGIQVWNAPDWDCDEIRPSAIHQDTKDTRHFRLTAHDSAEFGAAQHPRQAAAGYVVPERASETFPHVDLMEEIPLWPQRYTRAWLKADETATTRSKRAHNLNFRLSAEDVRGKRRLKADDLRQCLELSFLAGVREPAQSWSADPTVWFTTTGIDVGGLGAQGRPDKKRLDHSCLFTMATLMQPLELACPDGVRRVLRPGTRRVLDVQSGQWSALELIYRMQAVHRAFGSTVRVEKNAEQSLLQWMQAESIHIPLYGHTTGNDKHHLSWGVESVFIAFEKHALLIPSNGALPEGEGIEKFVEAAKVYEPPPAHTPDEVMAAWFAFEQARYIWEPPPPPLPMGAEVGLLMAGVR